MRRIFQKERPTNFKLGTVRRPASPTSRWRQRSKVKAMRLVGVFAYNLTSKSRRHTKIGTKVVRATANITFQFQGQKVKGQGHQAA